MMENSYSIEPVLKPGPDTQSERRFNDSIILKTAGSPT